MKHERLSRLAAAFLCLVTAACALTACAPSQRESFDLDSLPDWSGSPYVELYGNVPEFSEDEITTEAFEHYSPLDALGRCGTAFANVCEEIMPTEKRGAIGSVKPTGWRISKYDFVDGKYLYNRCHLIGYQLSGENANERNLITGTRYMNVEGMLPFENEVDDYIEETGNHVLYRVTPVYEGVNLVADGVQMEALSVEDGGRGVCFNVFCYNVQPGVEIDYATGENHAVDGSEDSETDVGDRTEYIINLNSKRFHSPDCPSVDDINESNRKSWFGTYDELIDMGYTPCKSCGGGERDYGG